MIRGRTVRCIIFGCEWSSWTEGCDINGRKCKRCGLWEYEDGTYLKGN